MYVEYKISRERGENPTGLLSVSSVGKLVSSKMRNQETTSDEHSWVNFKNWNNRRIWVFRSRSFILLKIWKVLFKNSLLIEKHTNFEVQCQRIGGRVGVKFRVRFMGMWRNRSRDGWYEYLFCSPKSARRETKKIIDEFESNIISYEKSHQEHFLFENVSIK